MNFENNYESSLLEHKVIQPPNFFFAKPIGFLTIEVTYMLNTDLKNRNKEMSTKVLPLKDATPNKYISFHPSFFFSPITEIVYVHYKVHRTAKKKTLLLIYFLRIITT